MDISPLLLSLKTACLATVITFFAGLWIAYKVIKIKHGKAVLDTILTLPMILPPTVVGFFLLPFFWKKQSVGSVAFRTWNADCIFICRYGDRICGCIFSIDVPNCTQCI